MQTKTKTHVVITSFAIFTALMAVGVFIAVWMHDEPTFQKDGAVWYARDMPLGVCIVPHAVSVDSSAKASKLAINVIEDVNKRFGFNLLTYRGETHPECVIFGTLDVPFEKGVTDKGGHAKWRPYENCIFRTVNPPPGTEFAMIKHELGHCLGLDHDEYQASVMYYESRDLETTTLKYPPEFSDDDVEAVRERYLHDKRAD